MRRLTFGLFLLASACAPLSRVPHAPLPVGARYVAMGSSFASGPLLGPLKPGAPARCARTALNYPTLLAERLKLTLDDVSCGGAETAHILGPWNELPAQIDAVRADTQLVTLTIGGNDLSYVSGLVAASCRAGAPFRPGPCPPARVLAEEDYARLERNLHEIVRQVSIRAPQAKLVLVQAVTLVPPKPCSAVTLAPADAEASRAVGLRLAAIVSKVARETGTMVVQSGPMSRQHTACSNDPWSNGMAPGYDGADGAPWHPTAAGMKAVADAVALTLRGGMSDRRH